jgi:predicted RND superfamily exporter protein
VDAQLFDPNLFSARLGELIAGTFTRMAGIVAVSAFVLLLVFFRNLVQALIAMLPLAAALACTLGTMGIMGRSLDIPGLMLTIVVMGMGIDYSLYLVRAYQHFPHERDAGSQIVRLTVLLAACSTLMGFGAMAFADHVVLKSAGLTTSGAIFYAIVMTFALLPYLQNRYAGHQKERSNPPAGNKTGPGAA